MVAGLDNGWGVRFWFYIRFVQTTDIGERLVGSYMLVKKPGTGRYLEP